MATVLLLLLRSTSAMQQAFSARQTLRQREAYTQMTARYLEEHMGPAVARLWRHTVTGGADHDAPGTDGRPS